MVDMLKYGTPPREEDCTDIGTVPPGVAPDKLLPEGDFTSTPGIINAHGFTIPPHRRAWLTVAHFRKADVPLPYSVRIPGVGRLLYDRDNSGENWSVVK